MQAQRHQIVHQVITIRNGIEDAAHPVFFLCPGNALETEISELVSVLLVLRHPHTPSADGPLSPGAPDTAPIWLGIVRPGHRV